MKRNLILPGLLLGVFTMSAQSPAALAANEGIWQGYDGEWRYDSRLLLSLADAIPADKYAWRPGAGVRSISEILMHLAQSNYYLLSITGPQMPRELERNDFERTVVSKPEVLAYLRRSLAAVRTARAQLKPSDLERKVTVEGETATVDSMYLRIICHENEHMGQLIAYSRVNSIVPPWSAGVLLPK
ncbi:MAG: DinB family protein [Janthinobacterium lividum]